MPNTLGGQVKRFRPMTMFRLVMAVGLATSCGGRAGVGSDDADAQGGAAGTTLVDASSGSDDGANAGGAGPNGGSSGSGGSTTGTGGLGGSTATGGAAGAPGGAGGAAGNGGGTGGAGGSGRPPEAGPPADISTAPDAAPPPDADLEGGSAEACTPIACSTPIRTYCGRIGDGCGRALDCGNCAAGLTCGPRMPGVCGVPCPLCPQVQKCESGMTTVQGTVFTGGANPDPVYGALVFVPNIAPGTKLPPLTDGPSCTRCPRLNRDEAMALDTTGPDGTFVLQDVPAGSAIPLVVQLGHWRYETTIDVAPCTNNTLSAGTARLPRTQSEGNIPLTAISTGNVDALECILRKVGVADSEFSNPTGSGRIHFYRNNGVNFDANTPNQAALVGTQASWDKYDQILLPCEGMQSNETADSLTSFVNYTSKGGRVFLTHFSYTWLYQNGGFATAGTWQVNQANPGSPLIANIDTATSKGKDFASWLGLVGALSASNPPQIAINDPRRNLNAVPPGQGGQRWIYSDDPPVVQQMVVETPITANPDNLCGRVIYSDFHVANAMNGLLTFPAECTTADFTAQEKALEFMLLDLSACAAPSKGLPPPPPIDPPPPPPDF